MSENFYTLSENIFERNLIISGNECKHITKILRKNIGDKIIVVDGTGNECTVEIEKITKEKIDCKILQKQKSKTEPEVDVTLACAVIKGERFDWLVEKVTEIGVKKIIPIITERTIVKSAKIERWKSIAISAMKQSKRAYLPIIEDLQTFEFLIHKKENYDLKLIAHEKEDKKTINVLQKQNIKSSILIIGPEGGFTDKEIDLAVKNRFGVVSLGKTRLRTETAGVVGVSLLVNL